MTRPVLLLLLSLMIGSLYAAAIEEHSLRSWVQCSSHNDCHPGSCCTIGQDRYTYPTCRQQLGLDEQCRPDAPRVINTTLGYPDGSTVLLKDAYLMLCPCSTGLFCDKRNGVCQIKQQSEA